MKKTIGLTLACALAACAPHASQPNTTPQQEGATPSATQEKENGSMSTKRERPETRVSDPGDTLFGTLVPDPYQWLEDEKSVEVQTWMDEQDAYARQELAKLPARKGLMERLRELLYIETLSPPRLRSGRAFYTRKEATQEKSVFFMRDETGKERAILDPHTLSEDLSTSIGLLIPSPDGSRIAYTLQENNADESVLYVKNLQTGVVEDTIEGAKYAWPEWTPDSQGFYYTYLPTDPNIPTDERPGHAEIRFHALGTNPENDPLFHARTGSAQTFLSPSHSKDGRWLFASVHHGWNRDDVYRMDLHALAGKAPTMDAWSPFAVGHEAHFTVFSYGDFHYILTDQDAPKMKLMRAPVEKPEMEGWEEWIAEDSKSVLESASIAGEKLLTLHLESASSRLRVRDLDGSNVKEVPLPSVGTVRNVKSDEKDAHVYFEFSSFVTPPTIYKLDVHTMDLEVWGSINVPADLSPYEAKQVWYPSKDGTPISMFVVTPKGMKMDGTTPLLLYGYGGFNISLLPSFITNYIPWLEAGGAFAIPNLRGGGEYGEQWHKDGMLHNKQNVFDDFRAAAHYLIDNGYTQSDRLAIRGGSNGGLLVGALMTQEPDLVQAVSCAVPLLDMVRYHLFGSGRTWIPEYGSAEDEKEFQTLFAYSPYHRVVKGTEYPAVIFLSADHDDRVDPLHARKMAALVQSVSPRSTLLRIERNAGHGGADKVSSRVASASDSLAFLMNEVGLTFSATTSSDD